MKYTQIIENKENINNNHQKIIFTKKVKPAINYFTLNEFTKKNEAKARANDQMNKKKLNIFEQNEQVNKNNNNKTYINEYKNDNLNTEEDLDIELSSTSKIIPINNFININQINNLQKRKDNAFIHTKPKIKRTPSTNSFFDDIPSDNQNHNITNFSIYNDNSQHCSEFNLTTFGVENRPQINSTNSNKKEDFHNITNNNINNITNNNINNNISLFNNKNDFQKKRQNSVITPDINKFLNINNDTTFVKNTNYSNLNNQNLCDEIQKLKKENKRLFLKNNELSLKIRTQETKTKINSNYSNICQKKLSSQREEFLLQKIKKLESELIKQKDLITKLTYNKRFNIGIRKIRVNSILIKGNNNKIRRKNSINSLNMNNLYCNRKKNNLNETNFNRTMPNKFSKYIPKNSKNVKSKGEGLSIHVRSCSSISASPKNGIKDNKKEFNFKNTKLNTTMNLCNRNKSIKLKLENFEALKNRQNIKIKDMKSKQIDKIKKEEIKINEECNSNSNSNPRNISNTYINDYCSKKLGSHKTYGKTSLIMSVINDNLLGNFNLSQYMNVHSNISNKGFQKRINLKRNSIY